MEVEVVVAAVAAHHLHAVDRREATLLVEREHPHDLRKPRLHVGIARDDPRQRRRAEQQRRVRDRDGERAEAAKARERLGCSNVEAAEELERPHRRHRQPPVLDGGEGALALDPDGAGGDGGVRDGGDVGEADDLQTDEGIAVRHNCAVNCASNYAPNGARHLQLEDEPTREERRELRPRLLPIDPQLRSRHQPLARRGHEQRAPHAVPDGEKCPHGEARGLHRDLDVRGAGAAEAPAQDEEVCTDAVDADAGEQRVEGRAAREAEVDEGDLQMDLEEEQVPEWTTDGASENCGELREIAPTLRRNCAAYDVTTMSRQ